MEVIDYEHKKTERNIKKKKMDSFIKHIESNAAKYNSNDKDLNVRVVKVGNEINKIISDGKIESRGTKEEILPLLQGGMKNCLCQMKEVALTDERYDD